MRVFYAIVVALALGGCEQDPDYVLDTQLALETGGMGGASGTSGVGGAAGMGAGGPPDDCDPRLARAALLFVTRIDDTCRYSIADMELHNLLREQIYSQDVPELTAIQAEMYPDMLCAISRLPCRPDVDPTSGKTGDLTTMVICPRYCLALKDWLTQHGDMAAQCFRDARR